MPLLQPVRQLQVEEPSIAVRNVHGNLTADVTGEVEQEEGILVIRRIHVAMHLVAPNEATKTWSGCTDCTRCTAPYTVWQAQKRVEWVPNMVLRGLKALPVAL